MSRISIGGKVYETRSVDKISLKDLVTFRSQAADLGLDTSFSQVEAMIALPVAELEAHPDNLLALAVTVWATRRVAGDDVTLAEAIDVPMADIQWLPDPEDHKPGEAKRPTSRTRKASAPVAAAAAAAPSE